MCRAGVRGATGVKKISIFWMTIFRALLILTHNWNRVTLDLNRIQVQRRYYKWTSRVEAQFSPIYRICRI